MLRLIFTVSFCALLTISTVNSQQSNCITPNRAPGVCINIRQCNSLLSILLTQPLRPEALNFLRQSQCGFQGTEPNVCCNVNTLNVVTRPGSNNYVPGENPPTTGGGNQNEPGTGNIDLASNPLLPTDCGRDLSQRLVGGERTELDEFPWMALLEYQKPNGKSTSCGGVLINSRYILTAAHCVKGKDLPSTWRLSSVRLGEYNTETEQDCVQDDEETNICADDPISVGIEEQIAHEEYRPTARDQRYDIALLRLTRDVTFTTYIKPICLPSNTSLGQRLFVAGWGRTENRTASTIKLKLALPVADKTECGRTYSNAGVNIGYGQICAGGQRGKDSCRGDSGGPLMAIERTRDGIGRWTAVGVVSFGPEPCGMPGWPGVYSRVIDFVPWILSKLRR